MRYLITLSFCTILFSNAKAQTDLKYSSGSISLGVVVSDFDRSFKFYTEVLGLQKTGGFSLDEEFTQVSGLSRGVPFDVTILKTVADENATELKLVSFNMESQHPEQKNIQDDIGVQYMTLFVDELNPFLKRIEEAKVKILGNTPIGGGRNLLLIQDPDGTFIELIGPLSK